MHYSKNSPEYKAEQERLKLEAEWNDKRKRSIWEVRKGAPGIISANLGSTNFKGNDRKMVVAVIEELVTEGTFVPRQGYFDWKSLLLSEPCIIKHLGVVFSLQEDTQQELQLDVHPVLSEPPARKEHGSLTDLQLFETEPTPTEHEPHGSPLHALRCAFWSFWKTLYQTDSKLAREYRGATAPDHTKLAQMINAILFGVASDKPEINPATAPRIKRAEAYVARYVACLRTLSDWEKVGLGDLP